MFFLGHPVLPSHNDLLSLGVFSNDSLNTSICLDELTVKAYLMFSYCFFLPGDFGFFAVTFQPRLM